LRYGHGTLWRYLRGNEQINKRIIRAAVLAKGRLLLQKKSISVFLHHFFLNTSIFKTSIFAYNISAPREKTYGNKMKEGDSAGEVQGVNEKPRR
jgi:hypothetical protein